METLAELQAQLAKLRKARAAGTARVEFQDGHTRNIVEYKSDTEMAAAISDLESRIAGLSRQPVTTIRFRYSKGV